MVFQSPVGVFYQNGYRGRYRRRYHWFNVLLPPTKEKVYTIASDVCLSVCLLARLLKNACMDLDKMLRVDRCRDMDELINLRAGTFQLCLGCQRAALLRGILCRENPTYTYWRRAARGSGGFKTVLFTESSEHFCRRLMRSTECPSSSDSNTVCLKDLTFMFIRQHKLWNNAQSRIATVTRFSWYTATNATVFLMLWFN